MAASATSGLTSDRTLNKVAFCSAIVAGAAYVSYKYFVNKKDRCKQGKDNSLACFALVCL